MKLEIGMYVRTKYGISKIISKPNEDRFNIDIFKKDGITLRCIRGKDVFKASHNIIEIIEPGDLMYIDILPDNYGGIVVPRVAETLNELKKWKEKFISGECILKTILTNEQIINNWY